MIESDLLSWCFSAITTIGYITKVNTAQNRTNKLTYLHERRPTTVSETMQCTGNLKMDRFIKMKRIFYYQLYKQWFAIFIFIIIFFSEASYHHLHFFQSVLTTKFLQETDLGRCTDSVCTNSLSHLQCQETESNWVQLSLSQ